jgi:hypothetical protein
MYSSNTWLKNDEKLNFENKVCSDNVHMNIIILYNISICFFVWW